MPKRKTKKYKKPKRPFDKIRINEENVLIKKHGLKNKKEIWKTEAEINKIRNQAKQLLTKSSEEQDKFIKRLQNQGFKVNNIADILALEKEDFLKRRLQSILVEKKLADTPKQARQFIVHKHVAVNNNLINVPSYLVPIDEEDKITLKLVKKTKEMKELENKEKNFGGTKENEEKIGEENEEKLKESNENKKGEKENA